MADRTIHVIVPAVSIDLLTLAEAKLLLGISTGDTSQDEQLKFLISLNSATIAELCNRTFAQEKVEEHWREVFNGRLFLSHWPVKKIEDIELVLLDDGVIEEYKLEEDSGKLSNYSGYGWGEHAVIRYTGGFLLPEEAPFPLKQACAVLIRDQRTQAQSAAVSGVKQIAHKEARITYFDTSGSVSRSAGGTSSSGSRAAVESLLKQYMRFEV